MDNNDFDSNGRHPDELVNGKITKFLLQYTGFDVYTGKEVTVVLTPDAHALIITQRGVTPYTGESKLHSRCNWFTGKRCASTVHPDLYKIWYDF